MRGIAQNLGKLTESDLGARKGCSNLEVSQGLERDKTRLSRRQAEPSATPWRLDASQPYWLAVAGPYREYHRMRASCLTRATMS